MSNLGRRMGMMTMDSPNTPDVRLRQIVQRTTGITRSESGGSSIDSPNSHKKIIRDNSDGSLGKQVLNERCAPTPPAVKNDTIKEEHEEEDQKKSLNDINSKEKSASKKGNELQLDCKKPPLSPADDGNNF